MPSWSSLVQRLLADPVKHLGRKDIHLFCWWLEGYNFARRARGYPATDPWDRGKVNTWVESVYERSTEDGCRQDAPSFALLHSPDTATAVDRFIEYCVASGAGFSDSPLPETASEPLDPFHSLAHFVELFRLRPGMYFYNDRSLDELRAFVLGYRAAEADLRLSRDDLHDFDGFQRWLEARYPFAKGAPWSRTINFLNLNRCERAWDAFVGLWDMFSAGESPESLGPIAQKLVKNISQAIIDKGGLPDRETITKNAKHMAP